MPQSHELPTPPTQLLPPSGYSGDVAQWAPTVRTPLANGESFTMATSESIVQPSAIGIDDAAGKFAVIGKLWNKDAAKKPYESDLDVAVKYTEASGEHSYFIVSDYTDEKGDTTKKYTPIPMGVPLTIGRSTKRDSVSEDEPTFLSGKKLFGKEFGDKISRKHLILEWNKDGIKVTDSSLNRTAVEAKRAATDRAVIAGKGVLGASGALIDAVPALPSHTEAKMSPLEKQKAELKKQVEVSLAGLEEIKQAIGLEEDLTELWDFGVKSGRYRVAAEKERNKELGPNAHRYVQHEYARAVDAEQKLPKSVMDYASDYRTHMVNKMLAQYQLEKLEAKS